MINRQSTPPHPGRSVGGACVPRRFASTAVLARVPKTKRIIGGTAVTISRQPLAGFGNQPPRLRRRKPFTPPTPSAKIPAMRAQFSERPGGTFGYHPKRHDIQTYIITC